MYLSFHTGNIHTYIHTDICIYRYIYKQICRERQRNRLTWLCPQIWQRLEWLSLFFVYLSLGYRLMASNECFSVFGLGFHMYNACINFWGNCLYLYLYFYIFENIYYDGDLHMWVTVYMERRLKNGCVIFLDWGDLLKFEV